MGEGIFLSIFFNNLEDSVGFFLLPSFLLPQHVSRVVSSAEQGEMFSLLEGQHAVAGFEEAWPSQASCCRNQLASSQQAEFQPLFFPACSPSLPLLSLHPSPVCVHGCLPLPPPRLQDLSIPLLVRACFGQHGVAVSHTAKGILKAFCCRSLLWRWGRNAGLLQAAFAGKHWGGSAPSSQIPRLRSPCGTRFAQC